MLKKIFTSVILILLLVGMVSAQEEQALGNSDFGGQYWQDTLEQTPFLDRLKMNFGKGIQPFSTTIISGALCPENPNIVKDYTMASTTTKFSRTNTQHIGEAFQLFAYSPKWTFLGEFKLSQGNNVCVHKGDGSSIRCAGKGVFNVQGGQTYRYTVYFCSDTTKQCTGWNPTCYDTKSGAMLYSRSCIEGSSSYTESSAIVKTREQFTSLDKNAPNCGLTSGSECFFSGSTCDGNARISCSFPSTSTSGVKVGTLSKQDCGSNAYCSEGVCVPKQSTDIGSGNPSSDEPPTVIDPPEVAPPEITPPANTLSGRWSNVIIPENVKPKTIYQSSATFTAEFDGIYYLEAWINNEKNPLSVVNVPSGSKCDGSKEASGKFIQLTKGQSVNLVFNTLSRPDEGIYTHIIGAYSNCLDRGGSILAISKSAIRVVYGSGKTGTTTLGVFSENPLQIILAMVIIVGIFIGIFFIWKKPNKKKK